MDEIKEIEESANSFLKNFYDTTYNDNKVLFNNMQSIYLLIIFLYYNMQELNIEKQDIQNGTRKDYVEKYGKEYAADPEKSDSKSFLLQPM